jgi:hypothetical protein
MERSATVSMNLPWHLEYPIQQIKRIELQDHQVTLDPQWWHMKTCSQSGHSTSAYTSNRSVEVPLRASFDMIK